MFSATFYQRRVRGRTYFQNIMHYFFNKLDIHTTYMHKYSSPLSLFSHLPLHILTQAITYNYVTLKPQGSMSTIGVSFLQRTVETDSGTSVKYVISPTSTSLSITTHTTKTQVGNMGYGRSGNVQIDLTSLLQSSRSCVADVRSDTKINLDELKKFWVKQIEQQCDPKIVVVLVGNKCDMKDKRQVEESEARSRGETKIFL